MINRKEILATAKLQGVPPDTIDKDYVLGHFLNTFFSQAWASENFVFKGGTCLRKCHFADYRFSEDVDMTILTDSFQLTKKHMEAVGATMQKDADIYTNILSFKSVLHQNQQVGWDIEICYWGANHNPSETPVFRDTCHTKIWCEFRFFEKMLYPVIHRSILHLYSDLHLITQTIPSYHVHEILSEKLRALLQRNRGEARDYYDIWYLKNNVADIDWQAVKQGFIEKCNYKEIPFKDVSDFFKPERLKQVAITWEKRLSHQLTSTINMEDVMVDLKDFLPKVFK
jgi:predicted nucleotidyltransferase component of viral defense system